MNNKITEHRRRIALLRHNLANPVPGYRPSKAETAKAREIIRWHKAAIRAERNGEPEPAHPDAPFIRTY